MASDPTPETPLHQSKPIYSNTPRKDDPTCHPELGTAELDIVRQALMHSMGETVPEVDVEWFLQHAVPRFFPDHKYDDDCKVLGEVMGDLRSSIVNGRWKWYEKDPCRMVQDEDTVFKDMESISDAVLAAGKKRLAKTSTTCRLRCLPRRIGKSEMHNSNFKGDANQLMEETTGAGKKDEDDFYIVDSVVNYEFKKSGEVKEVNKNVEQLIGNAARILFSDPLRRFRWSVSIEDTTMRLWFLSRSVCFVSKPFNFVMEQMPFVHFLLATSFASKTDLGYDPTVRRTVVKRGKNVVVYDYMVYDKEKGCEVWYRTVGNVISNYRANRPLGRAIRVWAVQELDDEGVPSDDVHVLRDYWITLSSLTEGQIQSQIFEGAARVRGNDNFKKYFMTILHDTIVEIDGQEDSSILHLGCEMVPTASRLHLRRRETKRVPKAHIDSSHSESTGSNGPSIPQEGWPMEAYADDREESEDEDDNRHERQIYEPRKHARLVFKERGTCLNKIMDQKVLFNCLVDALYGLEVFYDARWVHRDISTGNLLLCKDSNKQLICKISDLEYARPYLQELPPDATEHAHKTGTPAFMAVEVQLKRHIFRDPNEAQTNVGVQVLHNYFHDVESVWWIAIWHLFHTYPVQENERCLSNTSDKNIRKQKQTADSIFPASVNGSNERRDFFEWVPIFDESNETLLHNRSFSRLMKDALLKLRACYRVVEIPPQNTFNEELFAGVHKTLAPFFEKARDIGVEVEYCDNFHQRRQAEMAKRNDSVVNRPVVGGSNTAIRLPSGSRLRGRKEEAPGSRVDVPDIRSQNPGDSGPQLSDATSNVTTAPSQPGPSSAQSRGSAVRGKTKARASQPDTKERRQKAPVIEKEEDVSGTRKRKQPATTSTPRKSARLASKAEAKEGGMDN